MTAWKLNLTEPWSTHSTSLKPTQSLWLGSRISVTMLGGEGKHLQVGDAWRDGMTKVASPPCSQQSQELILSLQPHKQQIRGSEFQCQILGILSCSPKAFGCHYGYANVPLIASQCNTELISWVIDLSFEDKYNSIELLGAVLPRLSMSSPPWWLKAWRPTILSPSWPTEAFKGAEVKG